MFAASCVFVGKVSQMFYCVIYSHYFLNASSLRVTGGQRRSDWCLVSSSRLLG